MVAQRERRAPRLRRKRKIPGYTAEAETAEELGVGLRTLRKWRAMRLGPPWVRSAVKSTTRTDCARSGSSPASTTRRDHLKMQSPPLRRLRQLQKVTRSQERRPVSAAISRRRQSEASLSKPATTEGGRKERKTVAGRRLEHPSLQGAGAGALWQSLLSKWPHRVQPSTAPPS
jgi:hypothetical protein